MLNKKLTSSEKEIPTLVPKNQLYWEQVMEKLKWCKQYIGACVRNKNSGQLGYIINVTENDSIVVLEKVNVTCAHENWNTLEIISDMTTSGIIDDYESLSSNPNLALNYYFTLNDYEENIGNKININGHVACICDIIGLFPDEQKVALFDDGRTDVIKN